MFRTEVNPAPIDDKIGLQSNIFSIGSCFAENIGRRFASYKQNIQINPFGIIYNPLSIFSLIENSINNQPLNEDGFINRDGYWYHDGIHSKLSAASLPELKAITQDKANITAVSIKNADWIMITLGSAIVYETLSGNRLVANCHKIPTKNFTKRILKTTEIIQSFEKTSHLIKSVNPGVKFLFTVSPVRHIKDTIPVNAISKATLLLAINEIREQFEGTHYFPSFEIMTDDLRDYRFYADDMLHPSNIAEEYIWQKLSETCFSKELLQFNNKWDKISRSLAHKPFNSSSASHQVFLKKLLQELENLKSIVDVNEEIENIKAQII